MFLSIDGQKRSGKIRITKKKKEKKFGRIALTPLSGLKVPRFERAKISMQKPIYLLFSGARQLFLYSACQAPVIFWLIVIERARETCVKRRGAYSPFLPACARASSNFPLCPKKPATVSYASCKRCDMLTSCRELHTYLQLFMRPILRP